MGDSLHPVRTASRISPRSSRVVRTSRKDQLGARPQAATAGAKRRRSRTTGRAGAVRRASRAFAPMINRLGPIAHAEAVDQRGRLLIAGYAVKRLSASLSPRARRESERAVPRGAHRARSALSASTRESAAEARAARETPGVLGRNGEAPSDRSLGASVYRPSPKVGDERKMARAVGFEPTTRRLTAACSTTELHPNAPSTTVPRRRGTRKVRQRRSPRQQKMRAAASTRVLGVPVDLGHLQGRGRVNRRKVRKGCCGAAGRGRG